MNRLKLLKIATCLLLFLAPISNQAQTISTNPLSCLRFKPVTSGSPNLVSFANSSTDDLPTNGALSIEAWCYIDASASNTAQPAIYYRGSASNFILLGTKNNRFNFSMGQPTNILELSSTQDLVKGQWYHVAVVIRRDISSDVISMYINGRFNTSISGTNVKTIAFTLHTTHNIGYNPITSTSWDGGIDELRIYNTLRSEAIINQNYRISFTSSPSNLIHNFRFNEGVSGGNNSSITTTIDEGISPANGTLQGFNLTANSDRNFVQSFALLGTQVTPATFICNNSFTANWQAVHSGLISGYKLDVSTQSDFSSTLTNYTNLTIPKTSNSFRITGLTANTTYYYRVRTFLTSGAQTLDGSFAVSGAITTLSGSLASPITSAATSIEIGQNLSLANATSGGTWEVESKNIAIIDASSGVLTGSKIGNTNVIYATASGCATASFSVSSVSKQHALRFDGTNDFVSIPETQELDVCGVYRTYTLECWVNTTISPTSTTSFIRKGDNNTAISFGMVLNNLSFNLRSSGSTIVRVDAPASINDGRWHHVAVSVDQITGTIAFYQDGSPLSSNFQTGTPTNLQTSLGSNIGPLEIGRNPSSVTFFTGSIDEVRVWGNARTAPEIQNNWKSEISASQPNLIAYYKFDHGIAAGSNSTTATRLIDYSENNLHGTLTNFALTGATSNWVSSSAMIVPTATAATNVCATSFTANWTAPSLGTSTDYLLDVSTSVNFASRITGYDGLNVGNVLTANVTGLTPSTTYFYRVRAINTTANGSEPNSNTISLNTTGLLLNSEINAAKTTIGLGEALTLTHATSGGTWSSSDAAVAEVNSSGVVLPKKTGNVTITYTMTSLTCTESKTIALTTAETPFAGLNFDGIKTNKDSISIPHHGTMNVANSTNLNGYTIEAWINTTMTSATNHAIVRKADANLGYGIGIAAGKLNFSTRQGTNIFRIDANKLINDGRWHHVACVVNQTTPAVDLYIDGVKQTDVTIPTSSITITSLSTQNYNNTGNLVLGVHSANTAYFTGSMDEVRFWNIARTETEIANNWKNTIDPTNANLIAYYRFDQGTTAGTNTSTNTLIDYSNNQFHGTLNNFALTGAASNWVSSSAMIVPTATAATNLCHNSFTANWTAPSIRTTTAYLLDVSSDATFASRITGYDGLNVGNVLTTNVTGLTPSTTYFYRVRAINTTADDTEPNSNTISLNTSNTPTTPDIAASKTSLSIGETITLTHTENGGIWSSSNSAIIEVNQTSGVALAKKVGSANISYVFNFGGCSVTKSIALTTAETPFAGLNFDGGNDLISIPHNVTMNVANNTNTNGYTIEAWINTTMTSATNRAIVRKATSNTAYSLGIAAGKINFSTRTSNATNFRLDANQLVNDGRWHHVACVVNQTTTPPTVDLYIDGIKQSDVSLFDPLLPITNIGSQSYDNNGNLVLGFHSANGVYFTGSMDEVRFWNIARTETEIANNWKNTIDPTNANLIAYYRFDQGTTSGTNTSTNTLIDYSNNQFHGTLQNFALSGTASNWVGSSAMIVPTATAATNVCATSFAANWTAPSIGTTTAYLLDVSTNATFTTIIPGYNGLNVGNVLTANVTGLTHSTAYFYRVRAINTAANGTEPNSNNISPNTTGLLLNAEINAAKTTIGLGEALTLTHATSGGTWSSSDAAVAEVSSSGVVLPKKTGNVTITYTVTSLTCTESKTIALTTAETPFAGLHFDGGNDLISIPHDNAMNVSLNTNGYTIEAWINTTMTSATNHAIVRKGNNATAYSLGIAAGKLNFSTRVLGTTNFRLDANQLVNDGRWHHVACVVNQTTTTPTVDLYIDGVKQTSLTTVAGSITNIFNANFNTTNNLVLGFHSANTVYFTGSMDEVRFWNIARTETEIGDNWKNTIIPTNTNLIAYYRFDQGTTAGTNTSTNTLIDYSNNQFHGTLQNFALTGTASNWVNSSAIIVPTATAATNVCATSFTANWTAPSIGTTTDYLLDVSTVATFASRITGYDGLNVGNVLTANVTGLTHSTAYFYRVIAINTAANGTEPYSNTISLNTNGLLLNTEINAAKTTIGLGEALTLTHATSGGTWSSSDAAVAQVSSSGVVLPKKTGNVTITYTVTSLTCTESKTIALTITETPFAGLHFDGVDDSTEVPHSTSLDFSTSTNGYTIEAWVSTMQSASKKVSLITKGNANNSVSVGIFEGKLTFIVVGSGSIQYEVHTSTLISDGYFHHIACAVNQTTTPSTLSIYIDGVLQTSLNTISGSLSAINNLNVTGAGSLILGVNPVGWYHFEGSLDEVRIWNTVRSSTEINDNKNKLINTTSSNLLAYYRFDQGTTAGTNTNTNTLIDYSVNNLHGTLHNFALTGIISNWVSSRAMIAPTATAATNLCHNSFTANWTAPSIGTTTAYLLDVSTVATFASRITGYDGLNVGNVLTTNVTGLTPSTTYFYRVRAINTTANGSEPNSNTISVITSNTPVTPDISASKTNLSIGESITLTHTTVGGIWSSSNSTIVEVNTASGVALAKKVGSANISYVFNSSGCSVTKSIGLTTAETPFAGLNFDGLNDLIAIPHDNAMNVANNTNANGYTIEAWINTAMTSATNHAIVRKGNSGTAYSLGIASGKLNFSTRILGSTNFRLDADQLINDGRWHHVACVVNQTTTTPTVDLYIDGVKQTSLTTVAGSITNIFNANFNTTNNLVLGFHSANNAYFTGSMDEVRFWNTARTETEIANNWKNTIDPTNTNLIAYYRFDQGTTAGTNTSTNTLIDYSNNQFHGTLNNFALTDATSNWVNSSAMIVPTATAATNVCATSFAANWTAPSIGTTTAYLLDVSTNATFTTIIPGYNGLNVGNVLTANVTGLTHSTAYFYRVRAINTAANGTEPNSNTISINTNGLLLNTEINAAKTTIGLGEALTLTHATSGGTWSSSDAAVAEVSSSGVVLPKKTGNVTITYTVTSLTCTESKTIALTITQTPFAGLNFDGVNDSISIPHDNAMNVSRNTNGYTIEAWINTTNTNPINQAIVRKSEINLGYGLGIAAGKLNFSTRTGNATNFRLDANQLINDGNWHHVACVVNQTTTPPTVDLYIDGIKQSNVSLFDPLLPISNIGSQNYDNTGNLVLGFHRTNGVNFSGSMDEVRFWNTARTETEIANNWKNTIDPTNANLIAYYRFDQGTTAGTNPSTNTLIDYSNNQFHGTLHNFALAGTASNWVNSSAMLVGTFNSTTNICGNTATINWTAPTFATVDAYLLDVSTNANFTSFVPGFNNLNIGNVNSYVINGLSPNTYHFRVKASKGNGGNTVLEGGTRSFITNPCNYIWNGGSSGSWVDAANWNLNRVPGTNDHAIIQSPRTLYPTLAQDVQIGDLTINGGARLHLSSMTENDTLTINGNLVNNGIFIGSNNASICFAGSGGNVTLGLTTNNNLRRLIFNRAGASLTIGSALGVTDVVTVQAGTIASGGNLTLNSTSTLTARVLVSSGGQITGNVNTRLFIPGGVTEGRRAFRFFAHPFSSAIPLNQLRTGIFVTGPGGASNGFDATPSNNASAFSYNPTTGNSNLTNDPGWTSFANTTSNSWSPGQGIRVLARGDRTQTGTINGTPGIIPNATTITLTGVLNDGQNQTRTLARSTNTVFNLIGNPYWSPINLRSAARTNVSSTVHVYNVGTGTRGGYSAFNLTTDDVIIPQGAAFFLQNTATGSATSSIVFTENLKVNSSTSVRFRKSNFDEINIRVSNDTNLTWDAFRLIFHEGMLDGNDEEDAFKLLNPEFSLYSRNTDGQPLAIDFRKSSSKLIPLEAIVPVPANYILDFSETKLPENHIAYLLDGEKSILINANLKYKVWLDTNYQENKDRFAIKVVGSTGNESQIQASQMGMEVFPNPATEEINLVFEGTTTPEWIRIYDMQGKVIFHNPSVLGNKKRLTLDVKEWAAGSYIIHAGTAMGTCHKKFIVHH